MKREIKFRAWLADGEKGGRMFFPREMHWRPDDATHSGMRGFSATDPQTKFISSIVMQFTGLKDSKGVEIYEGDICQGLYGRQAAPDDATLTGSVWFSCGGFEITFPVRTVRLSDLNGNKECLWVERYPGVYEPRGYRITDISVIGNIYENPALLEATTHTP